MNGSNRQLLLIFVKTPVPGQVKTRLAASIGKQQAARIYRQLMDYTKQVSLDAGPTIQKEVWYAGNTAPAGIWNHEDFRLQKQPEGNLGQKMAAAFQTGFDRGFGRIVIIGSDCDQITTSHINCAFKRLDDHNVVLGPSKDGGYYLLGLNRWIPYLFENKSWSTDTLYKETVDTIRKQKITYTELEMLNDIDTLEDLKKSTLNMPTLVE